MDTKCIILGVTLFAIGVGLGFALNNVFYPRGGTMGTQLYIGEIEWRFEGDFLTMTIPIDNKAGSPVTIQSISVRENATGSIEYTDSNPTGIYSGTADIAPGGGDAFEWNATRGSAPFDFLLPGNTYIVAINVFDGYYRRTTTAPSEWT
jgi:hypothetical protein